MHIWTIRNWERYYNISDNCNRKGLYLRFDKDVDTEVRRACKEFCKWLRKEYLFPKRIYVYIKSLDKIKSMDGELVSATFFAPNDRSLEPYARISTGDYQKLLNKRGKDNALAAILCSISHELTHYFQWINDIQLTEIGSERQARAYAGFLLNEYAETREHP